MFEKHFMHHKEVGSVLLSGKYDEQDILFSIVIPTYRRPDLLRETLSSAIRQDTAESYEIIVVDNEPYEDTVSETQKVIQEFACDRLLYFRNRENIGMAGNWNRGVELARGRYITLLHDDDWLETGYLSAAQKEISGKKAILFKPNIRDFRNNTTEKKVNALKYWGHLIVEKIFPERELTMKDVYLENPAYGTLGIMFETEALKELGGFQAEFYPILDYVLLTRYIQRYGGKLLKKKVTNYRISVNESQNCSKDTPRMLYEYRKEMLRLYGKELKGVDKWNKELYVSDINNNEKKWGVIIEKPDLYEHIRNGFRYKIFRIKYRLFEFFRM